MERAKWRLALRRQRQESPWLEIGRPKMAYDEQAAKKMAAQAALSYVEGGMSVGLGTGSTAAYFIEALGKKCREEKIAVFCVCTSASSEAMAKKHHLAAVPLCDVKKIDIAVDGADQIDRRRNLIKGYGGALAREKVVDYLAEKFIVIADERKLSDSLDKAVPVEALPFCGGKIEKDLARIGGKARQRMRGDGEPFVSDNGMWIWDVDFGAVSDPRNLESRIKGMPGVLEVGLFTQPVWKVLVSDGKKVWEA